MDEPERLRLSQPHPNPSLLSGEGLKYADFPLSTPVERGPDGEVYITRLLIQLSICAVLKE